MTYLAKLSALRTPTLAFVSLLLLLLTGGGCIRRLALHSMADSLASSGDLFASDDDPELVRDAVPFGLKTIEGLLLEVPRHAGLLLSACQGFTQYSYAFVDTDAEVLQTTDYREAESLRARALKLYLRGRDYCLRGLELQHEEIRERLVVDPEHALTRARATEVPLLYWTGASWGSALSLGKDRPDLVADLPAVLALMRRALELDETYSRGAIHEVMIVLESLPANMGGSPERARGHFDRALELAQGFRAGPYTAWALNVSLPAQDRAEFEELLRRALEVDPDADPPSRLLNLIVQRRARSLLDRADDLFLED